MRKCIKVDVNGKNWRCLNDVWVAAQSAQRHGVCHGSLSEVGKSDSRVWRQVAKSSDKLIAQSGCRLYHQFLNFSHNTEEREIGGVIFADFFIKIAVQQFHK